MSILPQLKELKSRVADMEGQTRPSTGLALLEKKIQELEERLRSEERYNTVQNKMIFYLLMTQSQKTNRFCQIV